MKHGLFSTTAFVCALAFSPPRARALDDALPPLRLTIVGDSTVASYPPSSPMHGWGEFIAPRMRPRVQVSNDAVGGASSSSFIAKGNWDAALRENPTVVLIQFGHNDSFQSINPQQTRANLLHFVETARARGVVPVLVTPMQLQTFRDNGFVPSLQPYANAAREVAAQTGAALIDLHDLSGQLFRRLGPAKTNQLASPGGDHTHFNTLGAQAMAGIVLRELSRTRTPLAHEILDPIALAPTTPAPKAGPPTLPRKRSPKR